MLVGIKKVKTFHKISMERPIYLERPDLICLNIKQTNCKLLIIAALEILQIIVG